MKSLLLLLPFFSWALGSPVNPDPGFSLNPGNISDGAPQERIFNGFKSPLIPYIVSIQTYGSDGWEQHCGGSLISADKVISAAHCFDGMPAGTYFRAVVGTTQYSKPGQQIWFRLKDVKVNKYKLSQEEEDGAAAHVNDNAIVQLPESFKIDGKRVATIRLAQNDDYEAKNYFAYGWGYYECQNQSPFLRYSIGQLLTKEQCQDAFRSAIPNHVIDNGQTCANFVVENVARPVHHADSGGPLVAALEDGENILIGLVSYGINVQNKKKPCPDSRFPSVFSKVASYQDFIKENAPEAEFYSKSG